VLNINTKLSRSTGMAEVQHPAYKLVAIWDEKGAEFIGKRSMAYDQAHCTYNPRIEWET